MSGTFFVNWLICLEKRKIRMDSVQVPDLFVGNTVGIICFQQPLTQLSVFWFLAAQIHQIATKK